MLPRWKERRELDKAGRKPSAPVPERGFVLGETPKRGKLPLAAKDKEHHTLAPERSVLLPARKTQRKLALDERPPGLLHCAPLVGRSWAGAVVMQKETPHPFPLSGIVAVAGSRHGSPFPVAPVVRAVLAAGGSVRVGCASGAPATVRSCCLSAVVLRASSFSGSPRARLAARTRAVVAGADVLVVLPPAGGTLGPGSSLAVREALRRGLSVWCAGPRPSVPAYWQPQSLAGAPGSVCLPARSLF